ncbi:MAG: YecR family lipoprotein [Methyloglobulus sp.]|jgi:YecR-like lipoprotein
MEHKAILICLLSIAVQGCMREVVKDWQETDASRGDATVTLSYERSMAEIATGNEQQANSVAKSRCQTWGYTGAETFAVRSEKCEEMSAQWGCLRYLVTQKYLCTGTGSNRSEPNEQPSFHQHFN